MSSSKESKTVSLTDLFWSIAFHWRSIITAMVLLCVLLCGYKGYRNFERNRVLDDVPKEQNPKLDNETSEEYENYEQLSLSETTAVDNAVDLEKQIRKTEEYMQSSVYFNLDANRERTAILTYCVKSNREVAMEIRNAYIGVINSGAFLEKTKNDDNSEQEIAIDELVFAEANCGQNKYGYSYASGSGDKNIYFGVDDKSSMDMFTIHILGESDDAISSYSGKIQKQLEQFGNSLEATLGKHELILVSNERSTIVDTALAKNQRELVMTVTNQRSILSNLLGSFNEVQMNAYKELTGQTQSDQINSVVSVDRISITAGMKKYAILGLFSGMMLMVIFWMLVYILSGTVKTSDEISEEFGYYMMADFVPYRDIKKRFGVRIDRWLRKLRYRNRSDEKVEQELLASNVKVTCQKLDLNRLYLTSSIELSERENDLIEDLIIKLKEVGIDAFFGTSIERSAESFEKMAECGSVVFVERVGMSRTDSLIKMNLMAAKQEVKVLGAVIL